MTRIRQNQISIELPDDWEPWNQNRWANSDTMLAAKFWKKRWPNMEVTNIGPTPGMNARKTQQFARQWVRKEGVEFLSERIIQVDGMEAYEFCYKRRSFFRTFYFCKISVIIDGHEYLIQLASRNLQADKLIFDQIVQSLQFEFTHSNGRILTD